MKKTLLSLSAAMLFGAMAQAGVISDTWVSGVTNHASDNGGQFVIDRGGDATLVQVGDIIIGSFFVETREINGLPTVRYDALGVEWSGIFAAKVTSVNPNGTFSDFTFGALDASDIVDVATAGFASLASELSTWTTNSIIAFYEDLTPDFERYYGTPVEQMAVGFDGTKFLELGLTDSFQYYNATIDSDNVADFIPPTYIPGDPIGGAGTRLDVTANYLTDWVFGGVHGSNSDFNGNINLFVPEYGTFGVWADINFSFAPQAVPEPSSMVLLGLGALGMGVMAVRRRKQAAAAC